MSTNFKMIDIFNGKGVVFEKENGEESNKAVIIIDDEWKGGKENFEFIAIPMPVKKALAAIKIGLLDLKSIKKIAFLTLPENKEKINEWDQFFRNWIEELNCERIYILVDYFYEIKRSPAVDVGRNLSKYLDVGKYLIEYLEENYKNYKIAIITQGGIPGEVVKGRILFLKADITIHFMKKKELLPSILEWLEENKHPLDILWDRTKDWFSINDSPNNIKLIENNPAWVNRLHTFSKNCWEKRDLNENYKSNINKALDIDIPEEWFKNVKSVEILHESLKNLCGSYYCGTPVIESKYNLTMGAVYLIAILAMRDARNHYDLRKKYNSDSYLSLDKYPKLNGNKFLPLQDEEESKSSARSLYSLFLNIFRREEKQGNKGLKQFMIMDEGKKLMFSFEWSANQEDGLSEKLKKISLWDQKKRNYATLTGSIQALLMDMSRSTKGFGSPGTIWMEDSVLYVASANSPTKILIVCRDDREKQWADLFHNNEVSEVYTVKSSGEVFFYRNSIDNKIFIEPKEIPELFCCTIVHDGDSDLWDELKKRYNFEFKELFWFSGPGIFKVKSGLPIMRTTSGYLDITTGDVSQVVDYSLGKRSEIPDICKPKSTGELITAIFIFCMGYLSAGVGAGEINDDEIKALIGWNDKIKEMSPNTETDWKSGWEKVKNPQWWDDLGKIDNLKDQVRREMDGNLDEHVEKLIDYINGNDAIEDFETVKIVVKMLKEKKWS